MILGTPAYHIVKDQTDRIGIRTMILSLIWQPSRWPMPIEEVDAEEPGPPAVPGGVAFVGQSREKEGGAFRTFWTFEGVRGDGKAPNFKGRGASPDFSFQGGFAQVPIARHVKFQSFLSDFGGSVIDGEVAFTPLLSSGGTTGGSQKTQQKTNPLFGLDTFNQLDGTYTYRYAAFSLSGLGRQAGKIAIPPGSPPVYPNRNWLMAPLIFKHRGTIFDVTETYWLSGEGGWPDPIYSGSAGGSGNSAGVVGGSLVGGGNL